MQFQSIQDLLNYRPSCPFCAVPLIVSMETFWNSPDDKYSCQTSESQLSDSKLSFKLLSAYQNPDPFLSSPSSFLNLPISSHNHKLYSLLISINLSSNNISYRSDYRFDDDVPMELFSNLFNSARLYIASSCLNRNCDKHYILASTALRELCPLELSYETFQSTQYQCCNSFLRNRFDIWPINNPSKALALDFYPLTSTSTVNIDERIKTMLTFA
jgi:hypothetical protein